MSAARTLSADAAAKTDITDETYKVSNNEFLMSIFGDELGNACPVVVSFQGNPASIARKPWHARPWKNEPEITDTLPPGANNYFSLAVYRPDDEGKYRRKKSQFQALHAVMLDDVGTKVQPARLTLPPTWLLETSPGNHQAGYLLDQPLTDGPMANRLMSAIIAGGLRDPGANGPTSRLARLPEAVNGKHTPPFQCRMVKWSPELRYSLMELVDGLQLEMSPTGRPKRQATRHAMECQIDGDPIWIPRPEENGVLTALKNRGLYKSPLGDGKHDITCPWVQEHTDKLNGGTAYFEPDDTWPIGGFKCLHGHCAQRHIHDLLRFLDIEVNDARMKATICIMPGEIHRIADAAEQALVHTLRYYQRGGLIVTITTDPGTRETRVQNVSHPNLVRALAGAATWLRIDKSSKSWARIDPPTRHASVLLDSTMYKHLPVLRGLARQPYLRPDGSMMKAAGYDQSTGMYGLFDASEFRIPDSPTRADAKTALTLLEDLLTEFSFARETDRATALSAMLTAAARPSLAHAPMFHARAHMAGSGKSYLCELITAFATPQRGTPTTFPADDEECRKLLLAALMHSPAVIEFDNLTSDLVAHKSLCTALTSEYMSGRILGVSKTAAVSTRALFLSSGNNVGPVQDMSRRCITISLSPDCEVPAARQFERPALVQDVLRDRGKYVSAALTIVRGWIVAGGPKNDCKPISGYGGWSDLCRQPLLWLGLPDPAASIFEAMSEDPDRETLSRLLTAWHAIFAQKPAMVRDAVKQTAVLHHDNAELLEVINDIAEERGGINRRRLGRWIKRHAGRIVNGMRFVRVFGNRSAEVWQVELV